MRAVLFGRGTRTRTLNDGIKIRSVAITPYLNSQNVVSVEGFEPSISCSQSRRIKPDFPTLRYMVNKLLSLPRPDIITHRQGYVTRRLGKVTRVHLTLLK